VVLGFHRGDEMRWVDVTTTPLFAEDEELPTAIVAVIADVTEQHRAQDELELRGAQLEATNKELEAFVYSVSHDLRQPLSAINAFSQLVVEDAGDRLGDDEREFLRRVRAATQRMAAMLDGLLKLSRASRLDLVSEHVDVSTMASEILAELRAEQPERQVDCVVAPGLRVQADPALLRVILVNLLDNAFKFTSRHETARVEVGRADCDGEVAFFVRDDGDGFDLAAAGKLFQPFERLHHADEFPGTGIGLATVQRLVARYGGRVWAEAEVDEGATFYFTLSGPAATS
jgi:signal transduction histidine kinase